MTMREVPTYCRICEPQCAMVAQVERDGQDEQVIKLLPDRDHPVHKGFACHKGLNFAELHHDPDRIACTIFRVESESVVEINGL